MDALLATTAAKANSMPAPARILVAIVVISTTVLSHTLWAYLGFAFIACALWLTSPMGLACGVKRLLMIDSVVLLTILPLPFTLVGDPTLQLGGFTLSQAGLLKAQDVLIKSTITCVIMMSQCSGLSSLELSRALGVLKVPEKLILLLQFCVRYISVIQQELHSVKTAMRARGFGSGSTLQSWKSYGYLFGMLLIRSLARADRIWLAMKCRGYRGVFPHSKDRHSKLVITPVACGWMAASVALLVFDWLIVWA